MNSDSVMIEHKDSRGSVTQQIVDGNFPQRHNKASDSIAAASLSETHSNQDYVNAPKIDTHLAGIDPIAM